MKMGVMVVLMAFAVLMAAMLATGCVQESGGSVTTSATDTGASRVSQAEKTGESPVEPPAYRPVEKGNFTGDNPSGAPLDMPMNGTQPSDWPMSANPPSRMPMNGTPPDMSMNGNPPSGMPMNGTPPDISMNGNPPSGMPGAGTPPPGMPENTRAATGS